VIAVAEIGPMPGTVISLRDTSSSRGAQSVRRSLEHCRQHCHRVDRDVAGLGAHGRALLRCGQVFFTLVVVLIPKAIGA